MKIEGTFKDEGNIFFVSDLHYGHENIIRFCNRPFAGVDEMNAQIREELSSKLDENSILFDLGDLSHRASENDVCDLLDAIPTKNIYKVMGNHDKHKMYFGKSDSLRKRFKVLCDLAEIKVERDSKEYRVILSHYPLISWNCMNKGSIHLHGHTHGNLDSFASERSSLMVDVGYDATLAKGIGSFVIPFGAVLDHFYAKTGGEEFGAWVKSFFKER